MPIKLLDPDKTYTNADYAELKGLVIDAVKKLVAEAGLAPDEAEKQEKEQLGQVGKRMGTLLKPSNPKIEEFADARAMVVALLSSYAIGAQQQKVGDDLEALAASHIGGGVAKGDTIPAWAVAFVKNNGNNKDPDLFTNDQRTGESIKPDVWSDTQVGIVGGAAKAKDLGNFIERATRLSRVCGALRKTALVFAADNTPAQVTEAARGIVGADNVLVLQADKSWLSLSDLGS